MRRILLFIAVGVLTACTPGTAYDIDVTCDAKTGHFISDAIGLGYSEDVQVLYCTFGDKDEFTILCDRDTYRLVNDTFYCSTKDDKSVRVRVIR